MRAKGFTLIELMVVVFIVGVLASIAIPSYFDYVVRSRIAEGFSLVHKAKAAVIENARNSATNLSVGFTSFPTAYVSQIVISDNGVIEIIYNNSADNATLELRGVDDNGNPISPGVAPEGRIHWTCHRTSDIAFERLPPNCRQ